MLNRLAVKVRTKSLFVHIFTVFWLKLLTIFLFGGFYMSSAMSRKITLINGHRLAFILVLLLAFLCIFLKMENNKVVQTMESSYSRSLYELVEYLDNVETLLAKAQITSSSEYAAKNLTEIWRKADLAQSSLSQIPITHMTFEKVEQFLNQLSDYSYSLSHKAIENQALTDEELKNIANFYERCKTMNITLTNLVVDMGSGTLSWDELTKEVNVAPFAQEVANLSQDSFGEIEENMQDYEGLIYDGPFSEHMTSVTPLGLGNEEVDQITAEQKIYEYVNKDEVKEVTYNGVVEATIPVHSFNVALNDDTMFYIDVTRQGGEVLWFVSNREVEEENLAFDEAKSKALKFLNEHGITNMKETYYTIENSMATINFAYVQDDVVCYPDLLKVKVALDDGSIIGFEAQSYYSSHHERNFAKPKVSIEEAREILNDNITIISEGLAVIPTDWRTELLTYEFKGKVDENEFIVYINAETGKEEKIFMIIDSPNGVLTV